MNKKILTAFLFGAAVLTSTSSLVSCKDYSDEISDLQTQVENNKKACETSCSETKTALEKEIADLKTQLEKADADLKSSIEQNASAIQSNASAIQTNASGVKTNADNIKDLTARVSSLENRIQQAENAIDALNQFKTETLAELGKKVDDETFQTELAKVTAKVSAVDEKYAEALKSYYTKDETTALVQAVKEDLNGQITALDTYAKGLASTEIADKDELIGKINTLKDDIQQKIDNLEDTKATKAELKDVQNDLQNKIDALQSQIDVLNVLIDAKLKSLVFKPEYYYWGIEADQITGVNVDYYTMANLKKVLGTASADNADNTYADSWICKKATAEGRYFTVSPSASTFEYYLNPSNADLTGVTYSFVYGDKDYTRAAGKDGGAFAMTVDQAKANGGILSVVPDVSNPEQIKDIANDNKVTVFALQATKGDTTITSDYAALRATISDKGYRLYNKYAAENSVITWYTTRKANLWKTGTWTGTPAQPVNATTCAGGDDSHLFVSSWETVYSTNTVAIDEPLLGNKTAAQFVVPYNSTVCLNDLVGAHLLGQTCTAVDLEKEGFKLEFELVGLTLSNNKTSESAHAAISEKDGVYTLRPQLPGTDGKQVASVDGEGTEPGQQSRSNIGRTPLVRVFLIDTKHNDNVIDYGYIRIAIVEEMPAYEEADPTPGPDPVDPDKDAYVWSDATNFAYSVTTYPYDCGKADTYTLTGAWSINWATFMYKMYVGAGVFNQTEFDKMYTPDLQNGDEFVQYVVNNGKPTATKATALGEIIRKQKSVETGEGSGTDVLAWSITADQAYAYFGNAYSASKDGCRAIRYTLDTANYDKTVYPQYIYVVLSFDTNEADYTSKGAESSATVTFEPNKNKDYWWSEKSNSKGTDEAHLSVESPDDPGSASTCATIKKSLGDYFAQNIIIDPAKVSNYLNVTDGSVTGVNSGSNLSYELVFEATTNPTAKGISSKTYTITTGNNGKSLYANGVEIAQLTTTGTNAEGVNNTVIEYLKNSTSEDLINYTAYNEPKSDQLTFNITLKADGKCKSIPVTGDPISIILERPINITVDQTKSIQDAGPEPQTINLFDLIRKVTDWRGEDFADHSDYWSYYNLKDIKIEGVSSSSKVNISGDITTTMNGAQNSTLTDVTSKVKIYYVPAVGGALGTANAYGSILYENNQGDVDQFTVTIPVEFVYEWGSIYQHVTVTILKTQGHAKRR